LFLTDIIYNEFCYNKTREICVNKTLKFIKKENFENPVKTSKDIKRLIVERLVKKISKKYITSVLLVKELEKDAIEKILDLHYK
jgi:hypothetical protein